MRGVIGAVKAVFQSERLEDLPARHIEPFRKELFPWLFGREALPRDPEPPGSRAPRFLAWLLVPEELPADESGPADGRGKSFLGELFAGEDLPCDGEPGHRGGGPPKRA